ncbi:hypothetical protein AAC387_Pa09g1066 [Persea americana]
MMNTSIGNQKKTKDDWEPTKLQRCLLQDRTQRGASRGEEIQAKAEGRTLPPLLKALENNLRASEGEVFLKVDLDLVEGGADRFKGSSISVLPNCTGNTEEDGCHKFGSFYVVPFAISLSDRIGERREMAEESWLQMSGGSLEGMSQDPT